MKKSILIILFITGAAAGHAQKTLTLPEIQDSIKKNHPALKSAEAAARAAEAPAKGAYSWMPPELGAGFFQAPYNVSRWKGSRDMPGMGMFMVSAEQMLPNKKAQDAEYQLLQSAADIELAKQSGTLNELLAQVRGAYYQLIVDEKKSALFDQNKKLLDFMISSAEIRYRNNLGNINSYYKLKAALAKLNTAELVLEADKKQQKAIVHNLMQWAEESDFKVDTVFQWYPFAELMASENPFDETSEYRVLEKTMATNALEKQAQLASLKPQFGFKFEHMVGFGHQPQMFSLMAMVKLPMAKWSARANRASIEALGYERESLVSQQFAYLSRERSKSMSLFAELTGLRSELQMYDKEIIPALLKNMQTLQISYEQNKAEIFELFDAWQSLLDARMEQLSALQRALELQNELMKVFEIL